MKHIVVVDDDLDAIKLYQTIFSTKMPEYSVEYISDPKEALSRVCRNGFDLLITDIKLNDPKISGFTIAKLAYPLGKPILIVTGAGFTEYLKLNLFYRDITNAHYMQKPINVPDFASKINDLLCKGSVSLPLMFNKLMM